MRQLNPANRGKLKRRTVSAPSAELFGVRRLMSCDSVRRNLKAIPMEDMKQRRKEPPHREFAQLTIPGLELVTVNDGMYADGYELRRKGQKS